MKWAFWIFFSPSRSFCARRESETKKRRTHNERGKGRRWRRPDATKDERSGERGNGRRVSRMREKARAQQYHSSKLRIPFVLPCFELIAPTSEIARRNFAERRWSRMRSDANRFNPRVHRPLRLRCHSASVAITFLSPSCHTRASHTRGYEIVRPTMLILRHDRDESF